MKKGLVWVLGLLLSAPLWAADRVALVIGNQRYERVATLANTRKDAQDMARVLRASPLNFQVIEGYDLSEADLLARLEEFAQALSAGGEIGLFYYAGHGAQVSINAEVGSENLLMPIDVKIGSKQQLLASSIRMSQVMQTMDSAGRSVNIIVLDACRDNPAMDARGSRGLGRMGVDDGFLIQFATAPGKTAADGIAGSNGAYTAQLLKLLATPDMSLSDVFTEVAGAVKRSTDGVQQPWTSSSLGHRVFLAKGNEQNPEISENASVPAPEISLSRPAGDVSDEAPRTNRPYRSSPGFAGGYLPGEGADKAGGFAIQIGLYENEDNASQVSNMLNLFGHLAYIEPVQIPNRIAVGYRVRVGPFLNQSDAAKGCAEIKAQSAGSGCVVLRLP